MDYLEWIAALTSSIALVVSASWFVKSKNKGHLFLAGCFLLSAVIFTYLAAT